METMNDDQEELPPVDGCNLEVPPTELWLGYMRAPGAGPQGQDAWGLIATGMVPAVACPHDLAALQDHLQLLVDRAEDQGQHLEVRLVRFVAAATIQTTEGELVEDTPAVARHDDVRTITANRRVHNVRPTAGYL